METRFFGMGELGRWFGGKFLMELGRKFGGMGKEEETFFGV